MFEILLIATSICIDSFTLGITYGIKKIKIPLYLLFFINIFSIGVLGISVFLGNIVRQYISNFTASLLSCILLIILGTLFILEGYIKHYISNKSIDTANVKLFNFHVPKLGIIIDIAIDSEKADLDVSGDIDIKESFFLGLILSIDSLGVGFGYAIGGINVLYFLIFVFFFNFFSLILGLLSGKKVFSKESNWKTAFIPGTILIILGFLKLL